MPVDSTSKRGSAKPTLSTALPGVDHRKRRRNRTTQSCLNCHTTKRACDRKRPCTRCTQLGLSGICVYEVDSATTSPDESSRLLNRVAELEGVVRELKNKPHPRWTDARAKDLLQSTLEATTSPPPLLGQSLPWADLLTIDSPRSSQYSTHTHSPASSPALSLAGLYPLEPPPPFLPSFHDTLWPGPSMGECCLNESVTYNMVVHLQSELRKAAAFMDSYHFRGPPCLLSSKIAELEAITRNALQNARQCSDPLGKVSIWDESGLPPYDDDSFMSWTKPV
ncbi:hypothetical protein FB45DRAFT_1100324 [Roridomyces roridus]|uniref:Zn(2)-C6 fungal-type domain-containing protein n=1 Tax=Roridomyces roridus TaxID=1738132 RepID=A0AAD7CF52_9AGAR|nr:hypothetical protein FB45DRAFT_1100324 [Roridomyces roridus]